MEGGRLRGREPRLLLSHIHARTHSLFFYFFLHFAKSNTYMHKTHTPLLLNSILFLTFFVSLSFLWLFQKKIDTQFVEEGLEEVERFTLSD